MPPTCDGYGAAFLMSHALNCWRGGLVIRRHNEICDALGVLACLAYKDVIREPVVRDGDADSPGLIADLGVRGVWQPQGEALFDVCVVDTDAQSYISRSVADVLVSAEEEKKSIDWLLRLAMLLFRLLSPQLMVPWVERLLCF